MRTPALLWSFALVLGYAATLAAADKPVYADPQHTDDDYAFQGEYAGDVEAAQGKETWGAQVIALGAGKFQLVAYRGGLPGAGWDQKEKRTAQGEREGKQAHFQDDKFTCTILDGVLSVSNTGGEKIGALERVERQSPTLGAKPPAGAVVLFDGSSADKFHKGRLTDDGLLMQGVTSKQKFQDCTLHIEFRLPYQPADRGQARGNSGLYLQGRYEVQMLDSFGLEGRDNECGALYTIAGPMVNMCLPPLTWQTYDIDFTAAQFDDSGKKTANARATVKHNGVVIQDNVELPYATRAAPLKEAPEAGPVYLQDHGNPVRYRNIWVVEK